MCVGQGATVGGASSSAGSAVVKRAVELQLAQRRRSQAVRYGTLNAALLLLLAYDLSASCPGHRSALHYVELGVAALLAAALLHHARHLLPPRAATLYITPRQQHLLALQPHHLNSSFVVLDSPPRPGSSPASSSPSPARGDMDRSGTEELSLSLSPARAWRASPPPSPPAPSPSPPGSPRSSASDLDSSLRDEFISDRDDLAQYLKQYVARARPEPVQWSSPRVAPPPPHYALGTTTTSNDGQENENQVSVGNVRVWWRLRLDPLRLTQFNLNLRLWLQLTILERLVKALDAADLTLERLGLNNKLAQISVGRLRALSEGAAPGLAGVLPYLEPYPDLQYTVRRIRELASTGCLSAYRWAGGGRGWDETGGRPTDAELLLHLFATYLDQQLPAHERRPFSDRHLLLDPAPAASASAAAPALAVQRVALRPPHYVLLLKGDTLDVGAGRNNLLHTLLLLVAAAAREPALCALRRLQLGRAGLNILWVIGR